MESELAIDASREAIKVCLMVGGPILGVCLIVGLLMGLAQAMSHIQDQALATVPKILAIFAVVGFALPWFANQMMDFSKDQFSKPLMAANVSHSADNQNGMVQSLLETKNPTDENYYQPNSPGLPTRPVSSNVSFQKEKLLVPQAKPTEESRNPFTLPSYRFSRRPDTNIEG